jgi:hypothetical protein
MKKLIQNSGVRKWYGDEWIAIQDEANAVIEGHFGAYGQQFILSGCIVAGTDVSAGLIALNHADGFKICRLEASEGLTFPCYLKVAKTEETRLYLDGATKPVSATYTAELSATNEGGYLELKADNSTPRFTDAIQDAAHRFCSDTEKTSYAGQAASAISTIRGGVADAYNTLEKLRALIPAESNLEALETELRGYIDGLTYLPTFSGTSNLSTNVIDWTGTPERTKTLSAAAELDASNLIVGKTIGLKVSGAYALTFTAKFKKIAGSRDYSQTRENYIHATGGSEEIIYTITYYDAI